MNINRYIQYYPQDAYTEYGYLVEYRLSDSCPALVDIRLPNEASKTKAIRIIVPDPADTDNFINGVIAFMENAGFRPVLKVVTIYTS